MWNRILILLSLDLILCSFSLSVDSIYLNNITEYFNDLKSFHEFYRNLLQNNRQHRLTDTVENPTNLTKIRSNDYNEKYMQNTVG